MMKKSNRQVLNDKFANFEKLIEKFEIFT